MTFFNINLNYKEKICCVYKLTDTVNHKSYIGSTRNLYNRLAIHKHYIKHPIPEKNKMYMIMHNLDLTQIKAEIIERCKPEDLIRREMYWTDYYDTQNNGYNIDSGNTLADNKKKQVIQYTLQGEFVNRYKSIFEASELTGINKGNIWRSCKNNGHKIYRTGKYIWKFC